MGKSGQVSVGVIFFSLSTTTVLSKCPEAGELLRVAQRPKFSGSLGELPDVFNKIKVAEDRMITADFLLSISYN